jgi:hypothetical protein
MTLEINTKHLVPSAAMLPGWGSFVLGFGCFKIVLFTT